VIVAHTFLAARQALAGTVGMVPTMGYLHEGHLACATAVRATSDCVVMSIFVNPLQFNDPSDLARYPRSWDRDLALAERTGVDVVFAPSVEEMYPEPPLTQVTVSGVTEGMEGARRPGHFDGVATIVAKLFAGIRPDSAAFGRKDAQQLAVVKRLVHDLNFPVAIVEVPTVREADGLALSSRNVFIADRKAALGLSRGLFLAADSAGAGERSGRTLEEIAGRTASRAGAVVEYAALADARTARRIPTLDRVAFLAIAARVGEVRLIDNVILEPDGTADRGTRLDGPSILGGS
jgi:pantoate--beta-alanine ligase